MSHLPNALFLMARLTSASVRKTFLLEFPKLRTTDQEKWHFLFVTGSIYSAIGRFVTEAVNENEITKMLDEINTEASRVYPNFRLGFKECSEFVDNFSKELYADNKYDKDFAFSDALGTWIFIKFFKCPPHTNDELRLIRQVGLHLKIPFSLTWEKK
jgi:hypothetical protein